MTRSPSLFLAAGAALAIPAASWGQSGDAGERQRGQGTAPAAATAVRGPAPPELPEMVRRDDAGGATMRATRLTEPLDFDGRLDDAIYDRVPGVGGFIQALPLEGEPATESTEVWIFYDDDTLYVAGRCWDSQPDRMLASEMRRDHFGIHNNENFGLILDTFYDRRNAFFFYMNPIGGFFDGLIVDEWDVNRDWTAVWDSRAARFENGWTVEMAIPFKTLRYASGGSQVWGINFRRIVRWKNEYSYLTQLPAAMGPRAMTKVSSAGTLVGLEAPA
ncbi:MAG: carbohydrate binding family 9 domain-containing protein, partial [Acidobacteriota bacterium]|nr:carbohydrate binding family 9 domain-containing protein [Acidobacteriota bacterium]